jgi:hypothetical protein
MIAPKLILATWQVIDVPAGLRTGSAVHGERPQCRRHLPKERKMNDFDQLAQHYIEAWNETDPALRRRLIETTWTAEGRYVDPLVDAQGHDAIDATIAAAQAQFPGLTFTLAGPVDAHHDQARFTWELAQADGEPLVVGFDVAERDAGGRLRLVLGFLDKVPSFS